MRKCYAQLNFLLNFSEKYYHKFSWIKNKLLCQARVSIIRIKDFLALPELEADSVIHGDSDSPDAVEIKGGKFSWDQSDKDNLVTLDE